MQTDLDIQRPQKRKIQQQQQQNSLPPLQRHPAYFKDQFKHSVLLNFNLQQQKEEKLRKIM
jgi:hypothetical protein